VVKVGDLLSLLMDKRKCIRHAQERQFKTSCSSSHSYIILFASGSGKTYTMNGIEAMVAEDIFHLLSNGDGPNLDDTMVFVSFFEIYGGRIQDLLNQRNRLKVLEDGHGEVVITGLREFEASDPGNLMEYIESAQK